MTVPGVLAGGGGAAGASAVRGDGPRLVARAAERAGLTEVPEGVLALEPPRWSGHSLRRGFATASRRAGHDLIRIGRHGGWADGSKVLYGYLEDVDRWEENPLIGVGL